MDKPGFMDAVTDNSYGTIMEKSNKNLLLSMRGKTNKKDDSVVNDQLQVHITLNSNEDINM